MRNFDFIHRWRSTLPWQCMASCPRVKEAFKETKRPSGLQLESQPVVPFPLIDPGSYHPELPPYRCRPPLARFPLAYFGDVADDEMAGYDIEVVDYADSLAEYYNLDVGFPGRST